ncbi:hypothetical protein N7461_006603 [Penicillium sp. DV-2018c]|nr:hypothetical protein N7461_006603 [Penicillium sp. DV-2018c]
MDFSEAFNSTSSELCFKNSVDLFDFSFLTLMVIFSTSKSKMKSYSLDRTMTNLNPFIAEHLVDMIIVKTYLEK